MEKFRAGSAQAALGGGFSGLEEVLAAFEAGEGAEGVLVAAAFEVGGDDEAVFDPYAGDAAFEVEDEQPAPGRGGQGGQDDGQGGVPEGSGGRQRGRLQPGGRKFGRGGQGVAGAPVGARFGAEGFEEGFDGAPEGLAGVRRGAGGHGSQGAHGLESLFEAQAARGEGGIVGGRRRGAGGQTAGGIAFLVDADPEDVLFAQAEVDLPRVAQVPESMGEGLKEGGGFVGGNAGVEKDASDTGFEEKRLKRRLQGDRGEVPGGQRPPVDQEAARSLGQYQRRVALEVGGHGLVDRRGDLGGRRAARRVEADLAHRQAQVGEDLEDRTPAPRVGAPVGRGRNRLLALHHIYTIHINNATPPRLRRDLIPPFREAYFRKPRRGFAMAYWLFKTEPSDYSFDRLLEEGRTVWDGVKNALARRHLRQVRRGDEIAVYHTGREKAVVGVARAASDAEGDTVQIVPLRRTGPVPLSAIKADPRFREFPLVRMGRLSVMPVPEDLWEALVEGRLRAGR